MFAPEADLRLGLHQEEGLGRVLTGEQLTGNPATQGLDAGVYIVLIEIIFLCLYNNNTALIKQMSLFYTALVMKFQFKIKKIAFDQ